MSIDWSHDDWAYMLGVVHGDGNISERSIRITVGYKDREYADKIIALWHELGCSPKVYRPRSALAIDVHSASITNEFRQYKGAGKWKIPSNLNKAQWLAGIFDTDGTVTMASQKCAVIITLKRSGNLLLVKDALDKIGIEGVKVHDRVSRYGKNDYEIEELRLTSFDKIMRFAKFVTLRHPRKSTRMDDTIAHIEQVQSKVPLWKEVALWLEREPRTWEEIAENFNLTKSQVDSVMISLKRNTILEIIPPPKNLTRYRVSGLLSSQETPSEKS